MYIASANFARRSEPVLNREGTVVYREEGTVVPSLNTGGRRKMFIIDVSAAN